MPFLVNRIRVVGRVAVCLSGSLPSESGVGREPGSMSFPCGTISASRKLPFPGDFCGGMGRMPVVTPKPAGLEGGTGVPGRLGLANPEPHWSLGEGALWATYYLFKKMLLVSFFV